MSTKRTSSARSSIARASCPSWSTSGRSGAVPAGSSGRLLEQAAAEREGKVRPGQARHRREPGARAGVPDPRDPGGEGVPRPASRGRVRGRAGPRGGRALLRRACSRPRRTCSSQEGDEDDLRRALELEPARADAVIPLARMLIARGEGPEALELLERIGGSFQADGLAARVRLQQEGELEEAFAALDRGELEPALQQLLDALPSAGDQREDVRRVIVGELDTLAPDDPLARRTRSGLASRAVLARPGATCRGRAGSRGGAARLSPCVDARRARPGAR